jgi:hypothetical protein
MKHLKKKIKKLKRSIYSDDEPAPTENDETVQPIVEAPAPVEEVRQNPRRLRPVSRADLLNYTQFGF